MSTQKSDNKEDLLPMSLDESYPEEEVKTKRDHSKRETIKRKKSKHSAKGKKRESSCGRRLCVLLLVVACVVALCYGSFLIYKWSSRSTCNVFGVSYPKDQQGLDHLTTCQRLTSVIISGDAFSSVIFPADGFNTVTSLTIQNVPKATQIMFGDNSFQKLTSIKLKGVDGVEMFSIGKDSFTVLPKLVLSNFPALKSVIIGERSLNEAQFELSYSPVQDLTINENAFSASSQFILVDLPALSSVQFRGNNFAKAHTFNVANLPALTDFTADYKCFRQAEVLFAKDPKLAHIRLGTGAMQEGTLTLEALPALETVELDGENFMQQKTLTLENLPALTHFTFNSTSLTAVETLTITDTHLATLRFPQGAFPHVTALTLNQVNMNTLTFEEAALQNLQSLTLESGFASRISP
ncbi:hypothetical protein BLSTO_00260 [Blastocystis sp. subtype 1]